MFKKIFLFGVLVWLNWAVLIVMFIFNLIRVVIDKAPFIQWWILGLWFLVDIIIAVLVVKYFSRNAGKIAAGTMKDGMKFAGKALDQFNKEIGK